MTGPDWRIRTFAPGDLGSLAGRQATLYAAEWGWGRPLEILLLETAAAFLRDLRPGRDGGWIAECNGRMLGSVLLTDDSAGRARLRLLYVEPDARGLGVGTKLVAQCLAFAREAGYRSVWLWTHAVLDDARRIYTAAGFRCVASAVHHDFGEPILGEVWEVGL